MRMPESADLRLFTKVKQLVSPFGLVSGSGAAQDECLTYTP